MWGRYGLVLGVVGGFTLLGLALGGVAGQGGGIIDNLDLRAINPVAFLELERIDTDERVVGPPAVGSEMPTRGNVEMGRGLFSRKLAFFVADGARMSEEQKRNSLDAGPDLPRQHDHKPRDEPDAWGKSAQRKAACNCPAQYTKVIERALIKHCGGFQGNTKNMFGAQNIP